jgi:dTDP-4-amino-4,6-dideoxygalactose transaminase
MIEFNRPFLSGKELTYIQEAVANRWISGNGPFTKRCQAFFEKRYGFNKCLLTSSCTDALEMAAILLDLKSGDEVIFPSFTFVSTANAFLLRGVKAVFADSCADHPNIDPQEIRNLITPKTKAMVVVHYGGAACDMVEILKIVADHQLFLVEDAAHAIDSFYGNKPLGSFGHLATFSFHETKNIICGEGGMLVVNDVTLEERAEIIWEKGTNRTAFYRGEVDKYGWVDIGSSFLPSDVTAAFLMSQLESLDEIQGIRKKIVSRYQEALLTLIQKGSIKIVQPANYATENGHLFAIILRNETERRSLIKHLREKSIFPAFHYQSLHKSAYFLSQHDGRELPNADKFSDGLLRLPLHCGLSPANIDDICQHLMAFFDGGKD